MSNPEGLELAFYNLSRLAGQAPAALSSGCGTSPYVPDQGGNRRPGFPARLGPPAFPVLQRPDTNAESYGELFPSDPQSQSRVQ